MFWVTTKSWCIWLGLTLVTSSHERGIPSTLLSTTTWDYVPALCTHRPSLLLIGWLNKHCWSSLPWPCVEGSWVEAKRVYLSRGSKSRNKVSAGEPAEGSVKYIKRASGAKPWHFTCQPTKGPVFWFKSSNWGSATYFLTAWTDES